MHLLRRETRSAARPVQAPPAKGLPSVPARRLAGAALAFISLAGCAGQQETPVDWWHDLQGGVIAEHRPPPPGADLPYPNINTTPPKPVLPSESYRRTLTTSLIAQRDEAERAAARHPIESFTPSPPAPAAPAARSNAAAETANATIPAAEAPSPKPAPQPVSTATPGLRLAGAAVDEPQLPAIPDAPPPPPSFITPPAQPVPAPPAPPPAQVTGPGISVLFATGSAVLDASQHPPINEAAKRHGKLLIEGHGDSTSDSPAGQQAALALALRRAQAVAKQALIDGVQPDAMILSANPFGRGVILRSVP